MNVTVKLPDDLILEARLSAVHDSKSLSAWVADLIRRELAGGATRPERSTSLIEALTVPGMPDEFYDKDLPLPDRNEDIRHRDIDFGQDDRQDED